jgi:hypothetical protein
MLARGQGFPRHFRDLGGSEPAARAARLSLLLAAALLAAPAQAPAATAQGGKTTAYDGTYVGVSAENNSRGNTLAGGRDRTVGYAGSRGCRTFRAPARLTIVNGVAQARWGEYTLRGSPTADGRLTMRTGFGQKFEGRIDGRSMVEGQLVGYCAYKLTWRKRS